MSILGHHCSSDLQTMRMSSTQSVSDTLFFLLFDFLLFLQEKVEFFQLIYVLIFVAMHSGFRERCF